MVGKPRRHPSPSLKLLKASEHLANCSSPRDANEINSAKCSSGHLQRARCQASAWSNPVLLLLLRLLSSSCPFVMLPHPLLFNRPFSGNISPPNLTEETRYGGYVAPQNLGRHGAHGAGKVVSGCVCFSVRVSEFVCMGVVCV